jgi:hypothetical protein
LSWIDYLASFNIQVVPDDKDIDRRLNNYEAQKNIELGS